jgi:hypothetical protein
MKEAHQHLNITQAEWDAMVADFKITLDKYHHRGNHQERIVRPSAAGSQSALIPEPIHAAFGEGFEMLDRREERHFNPSGVSQQFTYCLCRRR